MKRILYILMMAAVLVSCSKREDPDKLPEAKHPMSISVTDGGYAASYKSSAETRAMDNGYTTTFTKGDQIGLYVVKNNVIISNNIPLTHNGTGWIGNAYWSGTSAKYFAYYPYQANVKGNLVANASNDAGFFTNVMSEWTPASDQSTHALYTASDLMIGEGTLGDMSDGVYPLTFTMNHAMALVVIETPTTKYTFNNSIPTVPDYYIHAPDTKFNDFTPYNPTLGTYCYLVKPAQSGAIDLMGSYTTASGSTKKYAIAQNNIAAANYVHSKVDGGSATVITKTHTLQVGDFYMKDGSLLSESVTPNDAQKAACIGIVYWVGDATAKDKTLRTDHPGCTHGLVVALSGDVESVWQNPLISVQDWLDNNKNGEFLSVQTGIEADAPLNNIQGYNNTKAIETFNAANLSNLVTAVQKAVDYRSTVSVPSSSSNWYLPSAKELTLLCGTDVDDIWRNNSGIANRDLISSKLQLIGGVSQLFPFNYWSSSENSNNAFIVSFDHGDATVWDKGNKNWVRFSLAF